MPRKAPERELDPVVEEFLAHIRFERGLSANTLAAYRGDLTAWVQFLARRGLSLTDAGTPDVTRWMRSLRERSRYSPSTVARMLVSVRSLYRFLVREGRIPADPTAKVGTPKRPRTLPKAIRLDEIEALLSAPGDDLLGRRDRAILEVLYGSGLRISELVDLDVDDVDLSGRVLLVRAGKGSKSRRVPFGRAASEALDAYLTRTRPELAGRSAGASARGALFLNARGGRLTRQGAWKILKSHASRAGLADKVSPHTLRHSFATHMIDAGADVRVVQEMLGHASIATTQVYTLVSDGKLREVYYSSHPRARSRG